MTKHHPCPALPRLIASVALLVSAAMLSGYTFYELQTSVGPIPLRWYETEITVFHDSALTMDAPGDAVLDAISSSINTWNEVDCEHPILGNGGPVQDGTAFTTSNGSRNGANIIIFEDSATWQSNRSGQEQFDTSLTVALTTIFHSARTGEILNFALEMNDGSFDFGIEPTGYAFDIQNTLTHELGHVIGLDHTMLDVVDTTQQTMYFQTEPAETLKRDLGQDDMDGFCALYEQEWKEEIPDPTGCSAAGLTGPNGTTGTTAAWMAILVAALLALTLVARIRERGVKARFARARTN